MIGWPVTYRTDSAAPPRASPSSLVRTTPVKPTPSWKAFAVVTASWPIIASTTNSVSSGWTASRMSAACCHQLRVDAEPAGGVDDDDVVHGAAGVLDRVARPPAPGRRRRCRARARRRRRRPARPTTDSCWTALGRCRSAATSSGVWPWLFSQRPSLPASVVLPEPCRPASMITVGDCLASRMRRVSPPRISMSSSLTILMTCCAGFSAWETSAPRARSLTALMKARTTGQRDVGLEQRDADLAGGGVDVGLGQPALAAQAGEDLVQAVGEGLEHSTSSEVTGAAPAAPS